MLFLNLIDPPVASHGTKYSIFKSDIWTRKTDMLNVDLCLKNAATSRKRRNQNPSTAVEEEASFHFIAFVPVNGKLWKLDGLERQPHNLGTLFTKRR